MERLRGAGHEVACPDLPGHGASALPWWQATLGACARTVIDAASGLGTGVVAVGHSLGGIVITEAAHREPGLFAGLVYLCAFVPLPGERLLDLARADLQGGVPGAVQRGLFRTRFRADRAASVFYNCCSPEDARAAAARLCEEPNLPTVQRLSRPRAPLPARSYIECLEDRAISIAHQRWLHRRAGIDPVLALATDHSPFISAPDELHRALEHLAGPGRKAGELPA